MRKVPLLAQISALFLFATFALAACGSKTEQATPVTGTSPPAGKQWTEVVTQTAEGYRMGNPNAPIKLVEYGSRLCPYCGDMGRQGMHPLEENYVKSGKLSYEFRDFLIHGPPDMPASALGRCVGTDAFFPMLEQMFQNQDVFLGPFEAATKDQAFMASLQAKPPTAAAAAWAEKLGLIAFFKQRGLPEDKARACLNDAKALEKLAKTTQDGETSGAVTGTPTFILNDKRLDNVITWKDLEPALKNAGAR